MRINSLLARVALASTLVTVNCLVGVNLTSLVTAQTGKSGQPNISSGEQALLNGINAAPNPAAKLKAAAELIKKYPKSSARPRVASEMADQIAGVANAPEKISLAQEYQGVFTEPSEQEIIMPILIEAFAGANRFDEAFSTGAGFLKSNPDSLPVLVQLMLVGTEQAKQKNTKFVPQSLQYGTHAVELIEADKKPAGIEDAGWTKYKTTMLPGLYQSLGLLNLVKGDTGEAKVRLTKAAEIAPADPFNYLLLAGILNEEYQDGAKRYQGMPNGPAKDQELKKILASLDQVIDAYAHTIALSEGNARLQAVRQQFLEDLESYYKYRHNNSTAGMQQLIDKYKVAAKP
jgi:hypothetical protein